MFGEDELINPVGDNREIDDPSGYKFYEQVLRDRLFEPEGRVFPNMSAWVLCEHPNSYVVSWDYDTSDDKDLEDVLVFEAGRSEGFQSAMEHCLTGVAVIAIRALMTVGRGSEEVHESVLIGFENEQDGALFAIQYSDCRITDLSDDLRQTFFHLGSA